MLPWQVMLPSDVICLVLPMLHAAMYIAIKRGKSGAYFFISVSSQDTAKFTKGTAKTLINLIFNAGWSKISLFARVRRTETCTPKSPMLSTKIGWFYHSKQNSPWAFAACALIRANTVSQDICLWTWETISRNYALYIRASLRLLFLLCAYFIRRTLSVRFLFVCLC